MSVISSGQEDESQKQRKHLWRQVDAELTNISFKEFRDVKKSSFLDLQAHLRVEHLNVL